MKKVLILTIIAILLIPSVLAEIVCDEKIDQSTDCLIISPANMDCSTYDLYDEDGNVEVNNGAMSELSGSTGVYYATFNEGDIGAYTIVLCDNTTAHLTVINTTSSDPLFQISDSILERVNLLNSTVININATVEGLNESLVITLNNTLTLGLSSLTTDIETISTDTNNSNQIYLFLFIFCLAFAIMGYVSDDDYLKVISGMGFCALGIYLFSNGFYGLDNDFIQTAVSVICIGLGGYLMIKNVILITEESFR